MIPGVHVVRKVAASGERVTYVYAWRGGPRIMRLSGHGPVRLDDLAQAALARAKEARGMPDVGTLAELAHDYQRSPEWHALAPTTREAFRAVWATVPHDWHTPPVRGYFDDLRVRRKLLAWRDRASATPRAADARLEHLSMLFAWGVSHGRMNPTRPPDAPSWRAAAPGPLSSGSRASGPSGRMRARRSATLSIWRA